MQPKPGIAKIWKEAEFGWFQLDHEKDTNPFSREITLALMDFCRSVECDNTLKGMVITGGMGRSFSAGGDFKDVSRLSSRQETEAYLLEIVDLYQAVLRVTKPVLCLIDRYAIGQGLQVALMGDWRIGTTAAKVAMPELKNGVACPLGAVILEFFFGRAQMLQDVIGCSSMDAKAAFERKYFNEVVDPAGLYEAGKRWIHEITAYPEVPFRTTKEIQNRRLIDALEGVRASAAEAHVQSFAAKAGQAHFKRILKE